MRDLGVFTSDRISSQELVEMVRAYASNLGQPFTKRSDESVVGHPPDVLYIADTTAATNGYFSEEEKTHVQLRLGSDAASYVSIHFSTTDAALRLALGLAEQIGRSRRGMINYGGVGGNWVYRQQNRHGSTEALICVVDRATSRRRVPDRIRDSLSELGTKLKAAAEQAGLKAQYYFERERSMEAFRLAEKRLGKGNVHWYEPQ